MPNIVVGFEILHRLRWIISTEFTCAWIYMLGGTRFQSSAASIYIDGLIDAVCMLRYMHLFAVPWINKDATHKCSQLAPPCSHPPQEDARQTQGIFENFKWSGQIIIFHQPRFSWNRRFPLQSPPFGGKSVVWGLYNNLTRSDESLKFSVLVTQLEDSNLWLVHSKSWTNYVK